MEFTMQERKLIERARVYDSFSPARQQVGLVAWFLLAGLNMAVAVLLLAENGWTSRGIELNIFLQVFVAASALLVAIMMAATRTFYRLIAKLSLARPQREPVPPS